MLISLMVLALAAYDGPDDVIATAPATPAPPLAVKTDSPPPTDAPATTVAVLFGADPAPAPASAMPVSPPACSLGRR